MAGARGREHVFFEAAYKAAEAHRAGQAQPDTLVLLTQLLVFLPCELLDLGAAHIGEVVREVLTRDA